MLTVELRRRYVEDGVTWYELASEYGVCRRRYNDFNDLHKQLQSLLVGDEGSWHSAGSWHSTEIPVGPAERRRSSQLLTEALPDLPDAGHFGVRHSLRLPNFESKREAGLQAFLQGWVALSHDGAPAHASPHLETTLGRGAGSLREKANASIHGFLRP